MITTYFPKHDAEFEQIGCTTGRITSDKPMFELKERSKKQRIFVFGSNREGRHGAGAAKEALLHWGAKYGQADGRQGNSYAIITKELRKDEDRAGIQEVTRNIFRFIHYAERHPELEFYVTPVGTGLAGFSGIDILPLFERYAPENCILSWKDNNYKEIISSLEPWRLK